jgi:hypothetical protein
LLSARQPLRSAFGYFLREFFLQLDLLYHGVKNDKGTTVEKAYAATNQLEYFAELSCMYFVGCNYQPFNRRELQAYDPVGYAMIEKMWELKK